MAGQTIPQSLDSHALRVWKLIYQHTRLSRTELAALTGYSNFLVSRLCESLLAGGYISEVGAGDSTGGRRPKILAVTPGFGRIVGLHVGTVNARAVVTDIAGNVMAFLKVPSLVQSGPGVALPHLTELVARVIEQAGVQPDELLGIGVGISGISDRITGTTLSWPKVPTWKNVPVRSAIEERFPVPVKLEDTPRVMALAEQRFGRARNESEFLYLMVGAGGRFGVDPGRAALHGQGRLCWRDWAHCVGPERAGLRLRQPGLRGDACFGMGPGAARAGGDLARVEERTVGSVWGRSAANLC